MLGVLVFFRFYDTTLPIEEVMLSDGIFADHGEMDEQEEMFMSWWVEERPMASVFLEWCTKNFGKAQDDQTVICLHVTKRLPTWSLFTPRQVARVVH